MQQSSSLHVISVLIRQNTVRSKNRVSQAMLSMVQLAALDKCCLVPGDLMIETNLMPSQRVAS
jgi:hypothetical protein